MESRNTLGALLLGAAIAVGLASLGYLLGDAAIRFREYERFVAVKGLSEREFPADVVIWPIQFSAADNELGALYATVEGNTARSSACVA